MLLTKTKLDRDQRRELILDVAQGVFLEEGFAKASMSVIAAKLGGSKGTLYNYFKSKEELFNAYVERRCLWQDEIFSEPKAGETPRETLSRIARAYLRPAPWLLLDEPTEGLDRGTEAALVAALDRRLSRTGQGVVIVSHRPSPLTLCREMIDVSGRL